MAHDGETALDARGSLEVIEATRARAREELVPRDSVVYAIWGVAWLLGFGVTALTVEGPAPLAGAPVAVLALVWPVCLGGAWACMAVYLRRFTRGRRGTSADVGRRLWLAYGVAFVGAVLLLPMLGVQAPDRLAGDSPVMWEISMVIVFAVVVLYLADAAYCRDNLLAATGLWFGLVNALAALVLREWYGTLMALLGGGGFLAAAYAGWLRERGGR